MLYRAYICGKNLCNCGSTEDFIKSVNHVQHYQMVEVFTDPIGEWTKFKPFGDVKKRTRDGLRAWLILEKIPEKFIKNLDKERFFVPESRMAVFYENWNYEKGLYPGDFLWELVTDEYFELSENAKGRDICLYCGGDNSAGRNGWECIYCGGN